MGKGTYIGGHTVIRVYKVKPPKKVKNTLDFLEISDVTSGLIKASVFGFLITLMGCYQGFNSKGGAQGVGKATTNAVVSSSVLILASNYIMTNLFFVS